MMKVEAIIRPGKLDDVKLALTNADIHGMMISQVMGCGNQDGQKAVYRGTEYKIDLLPKIKLEIVVCDDKVKKCVKAICSAARSGEIGDGKIFISSVANAIRIRTGEEGNDAI